MCLKVCNFKLENYIIYVQMVISFKSKSFTNIILTGVLYQNTQKRVSF